MSEPPYYDAMATTCFEFQKMTEKLVMVVVKVTFASFFLLIYMDIFCLFSEIQATILDYNEKNWCFLSDQSGC